MTLRKFHRKKGERQAFLRGLAANLIMKEKITTTETRAKALRPVVEKLVTIARRQRLNDLRLVISRLANKEAGQKLFYDIAPHYTKRSGGYTRIVKLGDIRKRDGSKKASIEFVKKSS